MVVRSSLELSASSLERLGLKNYSTQRYWVLLELLAME